MKVTFFSNYFNAHQLPLALEFAGMESVDYTFVSLLETDGATGRGSLDHDYSFVLREYEGADAAEEAMRHAVEDDVVVFGDMAGKEGYVRARMATGKLAFRYAERLLKRGDWWRYVPIKWMRTWRRFTRYKDSSLFILCASAFTARDLNLFGFPKSKCFKWGYFPRIEDSCEVGCTVRDKVICSAQRLIPLKRVDLQIDLIKKLVSDGYEVRLCIAGDGPERGRLQKHAMDSGVADRVDFIGELDRDGVLGLMRQTRIFLATSNRKEGWGATVNEAMASGCCVVASDAMGASPFLIEDGVNGILYEDSDLEDLYIRVRSLLEDDSLVKRIGKNATKTIAGIWSPHVAAVRFYEACCSFLDKGYFDDVCLDGPMSIADDRPNS